MDKSKFVTKGAHRPYKTDANTTWQDVTNANLREVVQQDRSMRFWIPFEFDPKLNLEKNGPDCIRGALAFVKETFGIDPDARLDYVDGSDPVTVRHVCFYDCFVQGMEDYRRIMWHLENELEKRTDPALRVLRYTKEGLLEKWIIPFENLPTIVDLPSEEHFLLHTVPDHAEMMDVDAEWTRKIKESTLETGPCRVQINLDKVFNFVRQVMPLPAPALGCTPLFAKQTNKLVPRAVRIALAAGAPCPGRVDHGGLAWTFLDIYGEDLRAEHVCAFCAKSRPLKISGESKGQFCFLKKFWGWDAWIDALNSRYTFISDGTIRERILDDSGAIQMHTRTPKNVNDFLEGHKFVVWEEGGGKKDVPPHCKLKEIFPIWRKSLDRPQCDEVIFNPERSPGRRNGFLNTYEGLATLPKAPASGKLEDAAPKFRAHLRIVICGNDPVAFEYLELCLAQLVRYPGKKLGICIVLKGKQGAGKNTFLDVIRSFFGRHGIELTNARHMTGNFNAHLKDKIVIVLNEAVWGGDKQAEGTLKAAITENFMVLEQKGIDAKEGKNFWTLFISSNEKWCIPASDESVRRFVMLPVSDCRMGDKAYFMDLRSAIEGGEDREYLWYLLNRPCEHPNAWKPSLNMPPRTPALIDQMLQDRNNCLLRFLIEQLKEYGEWKYYEHTFISADVPIKVKGSIVMSALKGTNSDLDRLISSPHQLTKLLKDYLGEDCFDNRSRMDETHCYEFASAKMIKKRLEEYLHVRGLFEEERDATAPRNANKRRKETN